MSSVFPGGTPTFKLARSVFVRNGFFDNTDKYAKKEIEELSRRLSRKFLTENLSFKTHVSSHKELTGRNDITNETKPEAKEHTSKEHKPLVEDLDKWIDDVPPVSEEHLFSFSDIIDRKGDTSTFYEVQEFITNSSLNFNPATLLKHRPLLEFLFCHAKYGKSLDNSAAIFKYVTNEVDGGTNLLVDYIVTEAAFQWVADNKTDINLKSFKATVIPALKEANTSFADGVFSQAVENTIRKFVYENTEYSLVKSVQDKLNISDSDIPALVSYIKRSNVTIDEDNAEFYLSIALSQIKNTSMNISSLGTDDTAMAAEDFSVTYYDDDKSTLQVEKENVACAAQMFYVMTLGDELDIFNVINLITTKYLPAGKVDIRDRQVLQDLQLYVFSESFREAKNNAVYKRTHPEERRMFYKQVFNMGAAEIVNDMVVNTDFQHLWGNLLTETVKYISKVEQSDNPSLYVSRQNIFQAIEDIQYNLSTNCTGMAKVMTPIISKELDFVIERFLKKEDITRQLASNNSGSFWKVIERVLRETRSETPNVAALRNKAVFGHKILQTIANYSPATLSDDAAFSDFVSTVEAFIIANSQLEGSEAVPGREETDPNEETDNAINGVMNGNGSNSQWNF